MSYIQDKPHISRDEVLPFIGMIVDVVPNHNPNDLITLVVDWVGPDYISCSHWERFTMRDGHMELDHFNADYDNPGVMDIDICQTMTLSKGFKAIQYTQDTDLGI